jgi:hypothetical protein
MATGGEAERSREALRAIRRKAGAQMTGDQITGDQITGDRP